MENNRNNQENESKLYLDEEMEDTITLILEQGEVECGIIASFPLEGKDYVALLPLTPIEGLEENEILLYAYTREGDEFDLIDIEDDDEFEKVADAFDEMLDEAAFQDMDS